MGLRRATGGSSACGPACDARTRSVMPRVTRRRRPSEASAFPRDLRFHRIVESPEVTGLASRGRTGRNAEPAGSDLEARCPYGERMSIPVDLERLASVLLDYPEGYLLTASADGAVKAVSVGPVAAEGHLILQPSAGSAANLDVNPKATLLFPPPAPRGFTLLVDGTAEAAVDRIRFTPASAILHRPARHADGQLGPESVSGCENDCRNL